MILHVGVLCNKHGPASESRSTDLFEEMHVKADMEGACCGSLDSHGHVSEEGASLHPFSPSSKGQDWGSNFFLFSLKRCISHDS